MEEFEIEVQAEDYTNSIDTLIYDCEDNAIDITRIVKQVFQDGAKWGMESNWHDLRKNPNDLPKKTGEYFTNIGLLYYDKLCDRHFWHTPSCEACDYSDEVEEDEVIAWCELPQFKE